MVPEKSSCCSNPTSFQWRVPGHDTIDSILYQHSIHSCRFTISSQGISHGSHLPFPPIINFCWEVFISLINILWNCAVLVLDLSIDIDYWTLSRHISVNDFYLWQPLFIYHAPKKFNSYTQNTLKNKLAHLFACASRHLPSNQSLIKQYTIPH